MGKAAENFSCWMDVFCYQMCLQPSDCDFDLFVCTIYVEMVMYIPHTTPNWTGCTTEPHQ